MTEGGLETWSQVCWVGVFSLVATPLQTYTFKLIYANGDKCVKACFPVVCFIGGTLMIVSYCAARKAIQGTLQSTYDREDSEVDGPKDVQRELRDRERQKQEKKERCYSALIARGFLGPGTVMKALPDLGSRLQKRWYKVSVVMATPMAPRDYVFNEQMMTYMNRVFLGLQHPHVLPILHVSYEEVDGSRFLLTSSWRQKSSFRDYLNNKADPLKDWEEKYTSSGGTGLPSEEVAACGRQILEAMAYLYKQGFPLLGCIHTGNIFVCEMSDEETEGPRSAGDETESKVVEQEEAGTEDAEGEGEDNRVMGSGESNGSAAEASSGTVPPASGESNGSEAGTSSGTVPPASGESNGSVAGTSSGTVPPASGESNGSVAGTSSGTVPPASGESNGSVAEASSGTVPPASGESNGSVAGTSSGTVPPASGDVESFKETDKENDVRRNLVSELDAATGGAEEEQENGVGNDQTEPEQQEAGNGEDSPDSEASPDGASQSAAAGNQVAAKKFGSKVKLVTEKAKGAMAEVKDKAASAIKKVEERGKSAKIKAGEVVRGVKRKLASSATPTKEPGVDQTAVYTGRLFCRLSGYENILLGYKSNCYQEMSAADVLDKMDLVMFGHVIYEIATGCPVPYPLPEGCSVVDLGFLLDNVTDDDIREDLDKILKMELDDSGYSGAVQKILALKTFSSVSVPHLPHMSEAPLSSSLRQKLAAVLRNR